MLVIITATELKITLSGISIPGVPDDNICLKAYALLKKDFDLPPVHVHLHKIVPIGAGLGGGSADGAYTLKLLNSFFDLKLNAEQLKAYASQLGSDCAFFIDDFPSIGTGRGEVLTHSTVDLSGKYLVVIKPDIHVSTADAYAGVKPNATAIPIQKIIETTSIDQWRHQLENDFEKSVFEKYPEIKEIKNSLYQAGAVYASMSGSGSSVFGIFNAEVDPVSIYGGSPASIWSGWI
jgi:4-diphosphocytidyl-2-C-methyl-D-erythritol kinase